MSVSHTLTRDLPLVAQQSALLIVDVQNLCARRDGGEFRALSDDAIERTYADYFRQIDSVTVPNIQRLQSGFRAAGIEIVYTTIESLTRDGRDRSLDYKLSGFNVPKGSWDGRVIDDIRPGDDEIVFPKSSSSVFISTHIDYVLRNLGVKQLAICGLRTDHCVESAIRDACDLGYLVTQVTDACATLTRERHVNSLRAIRGYCRQVTTEAVLAELEKGHD